MTVIIIILIVWFVIYLIRSSNTTESYTEEPRKNTSVCNPVVRLFSGLTLQQKYAILILYPAVAGPPNHKNIDRDLEVGRIIDKATRLLGVNLQQATDFFQIRGMHNVETIMCTINNKALLDYLLVDYTYLIELVENEVEKDKSIAVLVNVYEKMGYTKDDMFGVLDKAIAMGKLFN